MGQGTEACADRPTEVSVIRFVSRNRTIEEIAPKKEVYTCKQRGCGKVFTNQDEYKTHEALEALKIRFICREPGCGEELSDPGSMWRHYQERHNNETNGFVCPYTSCGSVHSTADNLEDHIESCHRQPPILPIEPEIICFEGLESSIDEEATQNEEDCYFEAESLTKRQRSKNGSCLTSRANGYNLLSSNNEYTTKNDEYRSKEERLRRQMKEGTIYQSKEFSEDCEKITAISKLPDEYLNKNSDTAARIASDKSPKNESVSVAQQDFAIKHDSHSSQCDEMLHCEQPSDAEEKSNVLYINGDVTITKNLKIEVTTNQHGQEHRIDLGDLEKVFRSGFERDSPTIESNSNIDRERDGNCLEDEEYTPKKQRMSRYKQEPYKCDVSGCGKMYKYISYYRHHQDSHKLMSSPSLSMKLAKSISRPKQGKASTVSFFLCKIPGCGAEVTNRNSLWKHYHDNHANTKPPLVQMAKGSEIFRCKSPNCEMEFTSSVNGSSNGKTGNGSSIQFSDEMFQNDATAQQANFKTDFKAKYNVNIEDYAEDGNEQKSLPRFKEESRD